MKPTQPEPQANSQTPSDGAQGLPSQEVNVASPEFWRSLEELANSPELREHLEREFPEEASTWTNPVTRREFLMLMGASLALAGASGCSVQPAPRTEILPYNDQPEILVQGEPLFFATAMTLGGIASGVLVESHEGRPTKVEGNPRHLATLGKKENKQQGPLSPGNASKLPGKGTPRPREERLAKARASATDVFAQASILGLYDPDRSESVTYHGRPRSWSEAVASLHDELSKDYQRVRKSNQKSRVRILTETITSPSLIEQLKRLEEELGAKWIQYEPVTRDQVREGARLAFGPEAKPVNTYYDLRKAKIVLSLDADFLSSGPGTLAYAQDFSAWRRPEREDLNRLYMIESMPSPTGAVADHRLALTPKELEAFVQALAGKLGLPFSATKGVPEEAQKWLEPLARDLQNHSGECVVIPGDYQSPAVHALAHLINQVLRNVGSTVHHCEPIEANTSTETSELTQLAADMENNRVEVLLILGANPVYNSPADVDFASALKNVKHRFHLGLYRDETSVLCDWHIPEAHYLESWGDARAYDGTPTIIQPLIRPLYGGHSALELLDTLHFTSATETATVSGRDGYDIVRDYWRREHSVQGLKTKFAVSWQQGLKDGTLPRETKFDWQQREVSTNAPKDIKQAIQESTEDNATEGLEILFRPDPTLYDGRFANNGWLQELPKPITKLTWSNAAFVSPRTARELKLPVNKDAGAQPAYTGGEHGQGIAPVVELKYQDRTLAVPVWVLPGHADGCLTVHLGHGRERAGNVGSRIGFNAYKLRTSKAPWSDTGLEVTKTSRTQRLACTQMHHSMEGRHLVQEHHPHGKHDEHGKEEPSRRLTPLTLYADAEEEFPNSKRKWGMVIDLAQCTGCSACVIACQAENNIPVVGEEEVKRGREMHWIRTDRYFKGTPEKAKIYHQPVPCMQCENAPCELVCPVEATVHSYDGLNDMVYNRCVGTRYCSNNCPYKVRRFNFLEYAKYNTPSLKLGRNPEVTVRTRGVMEKCTYCVQRIRKAEIASERDRKPIDPHALLTACQAVCPVQAITFGDLNDKRTDVHHWSNNKLNYALLDELNVKPRTTYLKVRRNPNPEMEKHSHS